MKTYMEVLNYIHSLGMFSLPSGLKRITALLEALGNPQNSFLSVHIAGTNGKGSVAAMTSRALCCAGYKTGLFISPFIVDFRERIQINGEFIPESELVRLAVRVKNTGISVTEFEFITAVGVLYFSESGCEVCVCETGLGGRLDATNTLPPSALPVITKIGLDHTAILGDTIEQIAAEKCGIIKGNRAVTSFGQERAALEVIRKNAPRLTVPDTSQLKIIECDITGNRFIYKGHEYKTALGGAHQIQNALTAIEALNALELSVPQSAIEEGLCSASFPARLEVISKNPLVVVDGAHNPDGAAVLKAAMERYSGKITAIVGMMRDKSVDEFLSELLPICKAAVTVRASAAPRALSAEEMAEKALKYCKKVTAAKDFAAAVTVAKDISNTEPIFVFGSLYLASGIREELKNRFT